MSLSVFLTERLTTWWAHFSCWRDFAENRTGKMPQSRTHSVQLIRSGRLMGRACELTNESKLRTVPRKTLFHWDFSVPAPESPGRRRRKLWCTRASGGWVRTHEATLGWMMSPQTSLSAGALSPEGPQGRTQWSLQAWPPATWQAKRLQPPPRHGSRRGRCQRVCKVVMGRESCTVRRQFRRPGGGHRMRTVMSLTRKNTLSLWVQMEPLHWRCWWLWGASCKQKPICSSSLSPPLQV